MAWLSYATSAQSVLTRLRRIQEYLVAGSLKTYSTPQIVANDIVESYTGR